MNPLKAVLNAFFTAFETVELGGWIDHLPAVRRHRVGMKVGCWLVASSAAFSFFYLGPGWLSNERWLTEGQGVVLFTLTMLLGYGGIQSIGRALENKRS